MAQIFECNFTAPLSSTLLMYKLMILLICDLFLVKKTHLYLTDQSGDM